MHANRMLSTRSMALVPIQRTKRTLATAAEAVVVDKGSAVPMHLSLWRFYGRSLEKQPLLTKAFMASFIFFASDSATQYLLPSENNLTPSNVDDDTVGDDVEWRWDPSRALSGAGFGVVATTWLHYWWGFLETTLGRAIPAQRYRLANTLTKVAIDQLLGAPVYIYGYYVLTNFLQDMQDQRMPALQSLQENNEKATDMLMPTMWQHWKLWPLVHSFNFYFAPLHHRVLVQNCVLVGWSGYLSHLNHTNTKLMTPDEEIKVTIVRRETEARLNQQQKQPKTEASSS